jgi:ParB/RepB/Spo0J family partition protein
MTEQMDLIPEEAELLFDLRDVAIADLAHIETPMAPKKELVESLRLVGMLQPPIFREDEAGHLDIVIGRRRLAAARLANFETIRIFVAKTSSAVADVMTLAENAIRTANTVTEFDAIERLTKQGYDIKRIRAMTGMAQQTIKKRQALLRLTPDLVDAFRGGKMTATVADGAAKLPTATQKELIYALVDRGRITAGDLHEVRQARTQAAMQADLFDNLGPSVEEGDGPVEDGPIEAMLAQEIRSVIDRLPDYIAERQRSIINALGWSASRLIDLSAGTRMTELESAYNWDSSHPERDDQISTFVPDDRLVREIDPKYRDAPVERPDRIFTLMPIGQDISTSDQPAGNPPPRKPRKKAAPIVDPNMTDEKNQQLIDEEDEFIAGFVG